MVHNIAEKRTNKV